MNYAQLFLYASIDAPESNDRLGNGIRLIAGVIK